MFQECFKGVTKVFQSCLKVVSFSRVFRECFKDFTRVFQRCFKSVSRVLQECLKSFSRVLHLQGCFESASRVLQECFKGVSRVFQGFIQMVSRMFQESLKTNSVLWFASTQHSAEQLERVGDYNLLALDVDVLLLACLVLYSATLL